MFLIAILAAAAMALLCPQTLVGRAVRRLLVETPARALSRIRIMHLVLILLLAGASFAVLAWLKRDGAYLLSAELPEILVWGAAFDVASYVELIAAAWLVAATVRLRLIRELARAAAAWMRTGREAIRRAPRSRAPRVRPAKKPGGRADEPEPWGWAFA